MEKKEMRNSETFTQAVINLASTWEKELMAEYEREMIRKKRVHKCPICGKKFRGYGNNPQPLAKGRCCDDCNVNYVIPTRFGAKVMEVKDCLIKNL